MDIRQKYRERAILFAKEWKEDVSEHIIDIIVSVMLQRDGVQNGGGFVNAVCNNDLTGAITRADCECIKHLKLIGLSKINAFV